MTDQNEAAARARRAAKPPRKFGDEDEGDSSGPHHMHRIL